MYFELQGSQLFRWLVAGSHLLVGSLVLLAGLAWPFTVLALFSCGLSFLFADKTRRANERFRKLVYTGGDFILLDDEMERVACGLRGEILSTPWLIILQFNGPETPRGKTFSLVVFRDSLPADAWRRLRVALRILPIGADRS